MNERKVEQVYFYTSALPALFKHVGVYCRVSTNKPDQMNSLAAQVSAFVQMISKRNDMILTDIYIDFVSGEKTDRSEFSRMLADVEHKKLDVIITKSISRFGRNTEVSIKALHLCKEKGVEIIFDEEGISSFSNDSELIISILSAYAEAENESRRKNQLWSIKKRLEDGTSELYFRTCYGYRKNSNGDIVINRDEARVVQMIYSAYLDGASIVGIQKMLHEHGIPTARGNDVWSKRALEKILSNEKYTGDVIARKTITTNTENHKRVNNTTENKYLVSDIFPAIITKELFDAVQTESARRTNLVTDETGKHRKETHYSSKRVKKGKE